MTRKELISSMEYIEGNLQSIMDSNKINLRSRKEIVEFILNHREEYAKQEAIEFLKYLERNNIIDNSGVIPEQLYKIYQNERLAANKG